MFLAHGLRSDLGSARAHGRVRPLALVLLIFASIALGSSAHAQRKGKASPKDPTYEQYVREALAEHERGNWTEARSLFERAHEVKPSARTFRAIGLACFEEKRYVAAVANLAASLEDPRKPLTPAQHTQVVDVLRRARDFIAQYTLELTPEDAEVHINSEPPVIVDGKLLLDPGDHELVVSADGYRTLRHRVRAQPRDERPLMLELTPAHATTNDPLPAGLSAPMTDVNNSSATSVHLTSNGLTTLQYVGIGVGSVGIAGLVAGGVFSLRALSKHKESGCVDGSCPHEEARSLNSEARTAGTIATVALLAGTTALATGAFLLFWSSSPDTSTSRASVQLTPALAPTYAGATLGATW